MKAVNQKLRAGFLLLLAASLFAGLEIGLSRATLLRQASLASAAAQRALAVRWARAISAPAESRDLWRLVRLAEKLREEHGVALFLGGSDGRYLYHPDAEKIGERIPPREPAAFQPREPVWFSQGDRRSIVMAAGPASARFEFPATGPLGLPSSSVRGGAVAAACLGLGVLFLALGAAFQWGLDPDLKGSRR